MKAIKTAFFIALTLTVISCKMGNEQPNIVVILCDDLGYGDLSSYGHPVIETPNLDQIAEEGMQFTSFYSAAPVCSPSRAGLLTGRSPNRAGIYDFIPGPKKTENLRYMVHLQAHEETIPARLKSVGYATCLSGKWHCSSYFNRPEKQPTPDHFGFDHWFATHNNAAPSHENPSNFVRNGEDVGEIDGYSCQIVVDEALSWLQQQKEEQPFYLQITFHEPHEPVASPKELVDKYRPLASTLEEAEYFANVENVDIAVGRLVEYLKEKHGDNTLIVFTSDNGPETLMRYHRAKRSYGSAGDLRGMKLWTYEAGFRVPGIIRWLGKSLPKGSSDAVVSSLDFMPTFCELAGAELPNRTLDGESIVPLLEAKDYSRKKPLVWAFYNALNEHRVAMRDGDWKILARLKSDTSYLKRYTNVYPGNINTIKEADLVDFELYKLTADISESANLAGKHPEKLEAMKQLLAQEYEALLEGSHVWKEN